MPKKPTQVPPFDEEEPPEDEIADERLGGDPGLKGVVYVSRKVNDHDYGHGEIFTGISGITKDTTPEEMDEMLTQEQIAFTKIKAFIMSKYKGVVTDLPGV